MTMGAGSTQHQHLVQTEVPKKLLEEWLAMWTAHYYGMPEKLRVQSRLHRAGSELLELAIFGDGEEKLANVVFAPIHDRRGRSILSVRDQNLRRGAAQEAPDDPHAPIVGAPLQSRRDALRYVTPTDDNQYQTAKMKSHGVFREVNTEVGTIIVVDVNRPRIAERLAPDREALGRLIWKEG